MSQTGVSAHERDSQTAFVSQTGVPAHGRDSQAAFVSKTGVPAHGRDSQTTFVSKTGVSAHERDSQTAFVSKTGVPAHGRDSQTAFVSQTGVPAHGRNQRSVPPDLGYLILFFPSDALWYLRFMSGLIKGHYSLIQRTGCAMDLGSVSSTVLMEFLLLWVVDGDGS